MAEDPATSNTSLRQKIGKGASAQVKHTQISECVKASGAWTCVLSVSIHRTNLDNHKHSQQDAF